MLTNRLVVAKGSDADRLRGAGGESTMGDAERRIEDLEVKVSYLEAQLQELDALVRETTDRSIELAREVARLRQAAERDALPGTAPEKPPHY